MKIGRRGPLQHFETGTIVNLGVPALPRETEQSTDGHIRNVIDNVPICLCTYPSSDEAVLLSRRSALLCLSNTMSFIAQPPQTCQLGHMLLIRNALPQQLDQRMDVATSLQP